MIKRDSKGRFKKGCSNAWNKGKKCPQISNALKGNTKGFQKGNKFWDNEATRKTQFKKGNIPWIKGKRCSKEQRQKISENTKKGMTKEVCKRLSQIKKRAVKEGKLIMPKKDTTIEVKIQNFLKELRIEYFTHQYMHIKHGYQSDILIPSINLVIEADGDYWHNYPFGNEIDHVRTKELIEKGFKVLRLWEHEIRAMNINDFQNELANIIKEEITKVI